MLKIDVEAIAREFDVPPPPPLKPIKEPEPRFKTKAESTMCKKTGKVQFETAPMAQEALRRWKMKDRSVCWDLGRMRIFKCKHCHQFHMGKNYGHY